MMKDYITEKDIERAYKLLKTYYYYDNNIMMDTKIAIAKYECENILGKENWANNFKEMYFNSPESNENIEEKIKKISVIRVIKSTESIKKSEKESKEKIWKKFKVLTDKPNINFEIKYNYIIKAPIEIHILSVLWILKEGYKLDLEMSDDIYGSRLEINKNNKCVDRYKKNIFKLYHKQYSSWRDRALERVSDIINKEASSAMLVNLDIKRYYYSIKLDKLYEDILEINKEFNTPLFSYIQRINEFYNKKIVEFMKENKEEKEELRVVIEGNGLPIGLLSSQILSNFYLKKFDNEILKLLPDYYGRYVDDVIIIFKDRENYEDKNIELDKYIKGKLDKIISFEEKDSFKIIKYEELKLQDEKLKFYFFDKNSSNTLLEAFKEGIRKNTSIFNFYTEEEEIDIVTEDSLININYSGSKNKLSSIESFKNDKYKFSVKLSQLITLYKEGNSNIKEKEKVANIILKYFRGSVALDNFSLWEKIFIFLLMNSLTEKLEKFYDSIKKDIKKEISNFESQKDILNMLKNSLIFACCFNYKEISLKIRDLQEDESKKIAKELLVSNMYKHYYSSCGILTYLKNADNKEEIFNRNLFKIKILNMIDKVEIDEEKLKYSPRFIHYDELSIFFKLKKLISKIEKTEEQSFNKNVDPTEEEHIKKIFSSQLEEIIQEREEGFPLNKITKNINFFKIFSKNKKEKFNLGIVSINFSEEDIEEKVLYDKEVSINHIIKINKILNEAIKNKVDILIFPEVCIPEKILAKLVKFSREKGIAIVGGLQYIKNENKIYNTLVSILPFEINNYKSCFLNLRLKNYYSPGEKQMIKGYKYEIPINRERTYDLFSWRGLYFTIFNCFELTSLSDRALFKNYIDLMIASVYNRDIKYFRNIVDSTARDLHCFVAQVNVQKYGDSGVVVPKKSEMMVLSNIKGGINCNLLVTSIEIKSLREFQCKTIEYQSHDSGYKYTPPDIDEKLVKARMENKLHEYL